MLSAMSMHIVIGVCLAFLRAGQTASVTPAAWAPISRLPGAGRQHRDNADHLQTRAHTDLGKV